MLLYAAIPYGDFVGTGAHTHNNVGAEAVDAWLAQSLRLALDGPDEALSPAPACSEALLRDRLRFHGIAGLLLAEPRWVAACPPEVLAAAEGEARINRLWEDTHRAALLPLLDALAKAGIDTLLLKGTALAYSLYQEPAMRPRGDTDLLIRPAALEQARAAFRACGFVPSSSAGPERSQEDWQIDSGFGFIHRVDLHWQAAVLPALQRIRQVDDLFATAVPLPTLSPFAAMPDLAENLFSCAINQAMHGSTGFYLDGRKVAGAGHLGWLCDVHLIASRLTDGQWQRLAEAALDKRIAPLVRQVLGDAAAVLGTAVPPAILTRLASQRQPCRVTHYLHGAGPIERLWLALAGASSLAEGFAEVIHHLFPSRARLRRLHPDYPDWPLPLLHLRRIAGYGLRPLRRGRTG